MADLVAGDGGSVLRVTVRDAETQEPIDLTGHTVTLRLRNNGGALVTRAMTPLNQASNRGQAEYEFEASDALIAGTVKFEVRLDHGLSDQLTSIEQHELTVRAEL